MAPHEAEALVPHVEGRVCSGPVLGHPRPATRESTSVLRQGSSTLSLARSCRRREGRGRARGGEGRGAKEGMGKRKRERERWSTA